MARIKEKQWRWAILLLLATAVIWTWRGRRIGASDEHPWAGPLVKRDLKQVLADTLRVAVIMDPLVYEVRPGAITGLEYELLERFAARLDVPVLPVVVEHADSLLPVLQRGEADVAAGMLSPDGPLARYLLFTGPYRRTAPVLVALRSDHRKELSREPSEDVPDTFWLPGMHPFPSDSVAWDLPDNEGAVVRVHSGLSAEDLLIRVVLGRTRNAVLSEASARVEAERFPHLEFGPVIGPEVPLAFAVRRNSRRLCKALDQWLADPEEQEMLLALQGAYGRPIATRGPLRYSSIHRPDTAVISPFDSLFRKHDEHMPWDWHLLAAVAFKESRFDTSATSRQGAQGIMQMMPSTASSLGLDSGHVVDDQIDAARRYLVQLDGMWMRSVKDPDQRLCFVLASYNCGPGHVLDAQNLALALGLDPSHWEQHVERALLLLAEPRFYLRPDMKNGYVRGAETFLYVRDVVGMYRRFRRSG